MKKPQPKSVRKPWTVAIYIAADGPDGGRDLDRAALNEIALIKRAAAAVGSGLHVAIQVDLKTKPKIRRLVVGNAPDLGPEENAADPETLNGFFDWVHEECPADHYLVQFWGHSAGPVGLFSDTSTAKSRPETVSLLELRRVFRHAISRFDQLVDIVLFKDCWMSTLETVFQLTGLAKFMIASQGLVVPRFGWPYEEMFASLFEGGQAKLEGPAAKSIIEQLGVFYDLAKNRRDKIEDEADSKIVQRINSGDVGREIRDEVPFALLDVAATERILAPLTALVEDLKKERQEGAEIGRVLARASRGDPALLDLILLCENLLDLRRADKALRTHAEALKNALSEGKERLVVARRPEQSAFRGVSAFYFPVELADLGSSFMAVQTTPPEYRRLKLSRMGDWHEIALENLEKVQAAAAS